MLIENKPVDGLAPSARTAAPFTFTLARGAICDFSKRQLKGMFCIDGRESTADEATDHLFEALAQGKVVLPFGPPCDGFDFSGGGCPGHKTPSR